MLQATIFQLVFVYKTILNDSFIYDYEAIRSLKNNQWIKIKIKYNLQNTQL